MPTPPSAKPAPAPKPEEVTLPPVKKEPRFSREGILLNPEDCEIGSDGVVTGKS